MAETAVRAASLTLTGIYKDPVIPVKVPALPLVETSSKPYSSCITETQQGTINGNAAAAVAPI